MKLAYYPQKMPLKEPFVLSHGTFHHREALILELSVGEQKGYGEATVITYYGKRMTDFTERLEEQRNRIEALDISFDSPTPPNTIVIFEEEPFLQSALDCAVWDLWGKHQGIALHRHFAPEKAPPQSSFTLSGAPEAISTSLAQAKWPIYKVKLGSENDELILPILFEHSKQCEIRVDANGGWSPEKALKYCKTLVNNGISFIEQPVAPEYDEHIPTLAAETGAEIWADESAQNRDSISHCAKYYSGINFKLMKSGGLTAVVREIALAKERGLKVGLGCMTESSFGISALAQISALADSLDMDGNLLLAEDPGRGAYIDKGNVVFPQEPGIGCRWSKEPHELHP